MLSGAEEAVAEGSAVGCWALVAGEVGTWMAVVRLGAAVLFASLPFECSDVLALSGKGFVAFLHTSLLLVRVWQRLPKPVESFCARCSRRHLTIA